MPKIKTSSLFQLIVTIVAVPIMLTYVANTLVDYATKDALQYNQLTLRELSNEFDDFINMLTLYAEVNELSEVHELIADGNIQTAYKKVLTNNNTGRKSNVYAKQYVKMRYEMIMSYLDSINSVGSDKLLTINDVPDYLMRGGK